MTNDPLMTHQGMTKIECPMTNDRSAFVIGNWSFVIPWWVISGSFDIGHLIFCSHAISTFATFAIATGEHLSGVSLSLCQCS